MRPSARVRVFLVDDHEVVRRGVAEVLEDDPGITVAGEAGSMAEALARQGQPVLALHPFQPLKVGLVLTELVINANKYAYGGAAGPIEIALEQDRSEFRLTVADRGRGKHGNSQGFGTRMMRALVAQLSGALEYGDNRPGLRAVLTAPIAA